MPSLKCHLKMVETVNFMLYMFGHNENGKERKGDSASRPARLLPSLTVPGDWPSFFRIQPAFEGVSRAGVLTSRGGKRRL